MRWISGLAVGLVICACACANSGSKFTQITAWTPSTAPIDLTQITEQLAANPGIDPVRPRPDASPETLGALAGTDLVFVRISAEPAVGGTNPRDCIVVLAGPQVVDHYCELDGELLPRESPLGYLALPLYDDQATFVRLTICDQRYWERPYNGFVVFPITTDQSTALYADEVFRGSRSAGVQGTPAVVHAHGCVHRT